jgi:hypothetical protein
MIAAEDFFFYGGVTYWPWRWHRVATKPGDPVTCDVVVSQKKRIFGYAAVRTPDLAWPYLRWIWRFWESTEQRAVDEDTSGLRGPLGRVFPLCLERRWFVEWFYDVVWIEEFVQRRIGFGEGHMQGVYGKWLRFFCVTLVIGVEALKTINFMIIGSSAKIRTVYLPDTVCSGRGLRRVLPELQNILHGESIWRRNESLTKNVRATCDWARYLVRSFNAEVASEFRNDSVSYLSSWFIRLLRNHTSTLWGSQVLKVEVGLFIVRCDVSWWAWRRYKQIIWSIDFIERDNGVISMTTES